MTLPLLKQLHIFQLEHYSLKQLFIWWIKNPLNFSPGRKKPLIQTIKIKLLTTLSLIYLSLLLFLLPPPSNFYSLLLIIFPLPLIILAASTIYPLELIANQKIIKQTIQELNRYPNLITIGITGSFGKTTTKNILWQILNPHHQTLKTPQSYNTLLGIAQVIKLELTKHSQFFICEIGIDKKGDVKKICHMIPPDFSIITAIGPQHLNRFGSLQNIIDTKFEIATATTHSNQILLNLDNPHIQNQIKLNPRLSQTKTYSLNNPKADFHLTKVNFKKLITFFTLKHLNHNYSFQTNLFGTPNLHNLTAAISMAFMLKTPYKTIKSAVNNLKPTPHRLELKPLNQSTLIDNTFSSNPTGFTQTIEDLKKLSGKKALITPGIVELGSRVGDIHQKIGQLSASTFDTIVLVGQSTRTKNLKIGINSSQAKNKPKVITLDNFDQYWSTIKKLSQKHQWILLENDLPDNY